MYLNGRIASPMTYSDDSGRYLREAANHPTLKRSEKVKIIARLFPYTSIYSI